MRSLLVLFIVLAGCRDSRPQKDPRTERKRLMDEIEQLEHGRSGHPRVTRLLGHDRSDVRARAALALGRMGRSAAAVRLAALLRDEVPDVRRQAAFALRLLLQDSADRALARRIELQLWRRLDGERDRRAKRQMLEAIGRIGDSSTGRKLTRLIERSRGPGALSGVLALVRRNMLRSADEARLIAMLETADDRDRLLILMALALGKGPITPAARRRIKAAGGASHDRRDWQLRFWAIRALTRDGAGGDPELDWLCAALDDHRPQVQVAAVRALSRSGAAALPRLIEGLRRAWRSTAANHFRLTGLQVHPVLEGLKALRTHARLPRVRDLADEMSELSDATDSAVTYHAKEALTIDLVNCEAAILGDLGLEQLDRTPACGTAGSRLLTRDMRRARAAWVARRKDRSLRPYLLDPDGRVRAEALEQLGAGQEQAIIAGLADMDLGAVAAAARAARRSGGSPALAGALTRRLSALTAEPHPPALFCGDRNRAICAVSRAAGTPATARCFNRRLSRSRIPGGLPRTAKIVTYKGVILVKLLAGEAPAAVSNFAALVRRRFYRGTRVYEVRPGQELRTGCPRGDGRGGPGHVVPGEATPRPFVRGSVGLVADDDADSGGSRFFVSFGRRPALDGRRTLFGQVTSGMKVVERLHAGDLIKDIYLVD